MTAPDELSTHWPGALAAGVIATELTSRTLTDVGVEAPIRSPSSAPGDQIPARRPGGGAAGRPPFAVALDTAMQRAGIGPAELARRVDGLTYSVRIRKWRSGEVTPNTTREGHNV